MALKTSLTLKAAASASWNKSTERLDRVGLVWLSEMGGGGCDRVDSALLDDREQCDTCA